MKKNADAVIIGGGVMGCSILYNLATRGITNTVLVEKDALCAGSTGRSSGIVRMHYSSEVNARLALKSLDIIKNFNEIVGGDSGFVNVGAMFIVPLSAMTAFSRNITMQQSLGIKTRIIDCAEAREIAPNIEVNELEGICYEPLSGYADPTGVAQGYAYAARNFGAEISLENPALSLDIKSDKLVAVETLNGRIETDTVVLATGPWSGGFVHNLGIELPLFATRHEVIFLKRSLEVVPSHPVIGDLVTMSYLRPESPDLTLIGDVEMEIEAHPDKYNQKPDMDFIERIWARAAKRIPGLGDADYFTGYAGLYTNTPDGHPVIDSVEEIEGLYICAGFNGHGFKESPAVGIAVSELISEGSATTVDISTLGLNRFQEGDLNKRNYASKVIG